jgi:hypothetical protein
VPPREYHFPCVECGERDGVAYTNSPRMACCDRCRRIRRAQGRNTTEVACRTCSKKLYVQVRLVSQWDGFCPSCRPRSQEQLDAEQLDQEEWAAIGDWFDNIKAPKGPVPIGVRANDAFKVPDVNVRGCRGDRELVAFSATRDFKINNFDVVKGDLVLFDGHQAIIRGYTFNMGQLNGAIKIGWLVEGKIRTRFQRDDVI